MVPKALHLHQFKIKNLKLKVKDLEEQLEGKISNAKIKNMCGFSKAMDVYTGLIDDFDSMTKDILLNV
jgi:hypothetical protein